MNVSLTVELEAFVSTKVDSGRYSSASEVVREALRLLEEQDRLRLLRVAEFDQELSLRLRSLEGGERTEAAEVRGRIGARSENRRKMGV